MWFLTRLGALSVVQAGPDPDATGKPRKLMIRARVRKHLELLQRDHVTLRRYPIIESEPHRDYRWRIIVPRTTFARAVATMIERLDYPNFKAACAASPDLDQSYNSSLHEIWATLQRLQVTASDRRG